MAARPQNIGIKAIEVYFPTQVSQEKREKNNMLWQFILTPSSVSTKSNSRSTME